MPRFRYMLVAKLAVAVLAIPALTLGAVACGDDDNTAESNNNASAQDVDAINARITRNEQLFAVNTLDGLGLHEIDEQLNGEGTIDPEFSPKATTAVRVLHLTDWGEFQTDADVVKGHAQDLLTALHAEDVQAAGAAAGLLHETSHELTEAVWNELAEGLPPELGGPEEEHDDSSTPAADETQADGEEHDERTPESEATPSE